MIPAGIRILRWGCDDAVGSQQYAFHAFRVDMPTPTSGNGHCSKQWIKAVAQMRDLRATVRHLLCTHQLFPVVRKKNASLVVGSSLNAGFISGSPRYNYGKESYKIPIEFLEKRKRLREVAANHGVDLRTAALQFSAAPDVAAALVVGASSEQQILADYTSMQTKIPAEFWAELKADKLIVENAPTPA
jgi:Aldo/keto reductase family